MIFRSVRPKSQWNKVCKIELLWSTCADFFRNGKSLLYPVVLQFVQNKHSTLMHIIRKGPFLAEGTRDCIVFIGPRPQYKRLQLLFIF